MPFPSKSEPIIKRVSPPNAYSTHLIPEENARRHKHLSATAIDVLFKYLMRYNFTRSHRSLGYRASVQCLAFCFYFFSFSFQTLLASPCGVLEESSKGLDQLATIFCPKESCNENDFFFSPDSRRH